LCYSLKEEGLFVRIDKMKKKIPILLFLRILGFSNKKVIHTLKEFSFLEKLGIFPFFSFEELLLELKGFLGVNKLGLLCIDFLLYV